MNLRLWMERQEKQRRNKFFGVPCKLNKAQRELLLKVGKLPDLPAELKCVEKKPKNLPQKKKPVLKMWQEVKPWRVGIFELDLCNAFAPVPEKDPKLPAGKISTFNSSYEFVEALQKKGWERIGGGAYSYVMGKPGSDKVMKISKSQWDGGWMEYIKWATENGFAGTFAPKVYSWKKIKGKECDFSICSMERLDKVFSEYDHKGEVYAAYNLFSLQVQKGNETAGLLSDLLYPGLGTFNAKFKKRFERSGLDIHRENFMTRKDGGFVCIDPISSGGSYPTNRFRLADYLQNSQALAVAQ